MKTSIASFVSALVCLAGSAAADAKFAHLGRLIPPSPEVSDLPITLASGVNITGNSTFTQLLDHDDPSKGTFQQRFWWNAEWWAGPGSPVVLFTPGEIAATLYTGYLTNATITGLYAQEIEGAVVMLEHRYWGESSPSDELDAETLQYLTLNQAIHDLTYFAQNVDLPFDTDSSSNSANAPWVLSGGSYSGALSAWTESVAPGTFWAYHASSAPVEAISDYWQYFVPVQEGMAKNCSSDVTLVIDYMDNVLETGTAAEMTALKTMFGLEALEHNDDFMGALENGPWLWQSNSFTTGYSGFFKFCDAIENVTAGAAVTPDASGVGLETALAGYASWIQSTFIPGYCRNFGYIDELDLSCMDTYNASNLLFSSTNINDVAAINGDRQWNWMLCNEPFAYWQDGAPRGTPTIVSRLINAAYWQRQCALWFPTVNGYTYGSAISADNNVHQVNKYTEGWRLDDTTRVTWTNGEFDPWRTSGMSSEFRTDGPLASTTQHPVNVIPGGFHCSDLILSNGKANAGVQAVIDTEVAQIVAWVKEYPAK